MFDAFGRSVATHAEISAVAGGLVCVAELAALPARTLDALPLEQDVPIHAGHAGGWGGWVAPEAPTPAKVESAHIGGAVGLKI